MKNAVFITGACRGTGYRIAEVFVQTVVLCAADLGFGTDLSKNVTGSELIVDGGMASRLYPDYLNELIRKEQ